MVGAAPINVDAYDWFLEPVPAPLHLAAGVFGLATENMPTLMVAAIAAAFMVDPMLAGGALAAGWFLRHPGAAVGAATAVALVVELLVHKLQAGFEARGPQANTLVLRVYVAVTLGSLANGIAAYRRAGNTEGV